MGYMLLIVEPLGQREERGEAGGREAYAQMLAYAGELQRAGALKAVESLATAGSRLQVRGGERRIVDGPYAEAREMVGGFFLLADHVGRDDALEWAARCPAAQWATVEVRQTAPCYM